MRHDTTNAPSSGVVRIMIISSEIVNWFVLIKTIIYTCPTQQQWIQCVENELRTEAHGRNRHSLPDTEVRYQHLWAFVFFLSDYWSSDLTYAARWRIYWVEISFWAYAKHHDTFVPARNHFEKTSFLILSANYPHSSHFYLLSDSFLKDKLTDSNLNETNAHLCS